MIKPETQEAVQFLAQASDDLTQTLAGAARGPFVQAARQAVQIIHGNLQEQAQRIAELTSELEELKSKPTGKASTNKGS